MYAKDFIHLFEKKVPLESALPGDHNGLILGDEQKIINRIWGCLELTEDVLQHCIEKEIDMLFLHHHPMYLPIRQLTFQNPHQYLLAKCLKHGINIYVSHTNLDAVDGGLNDYIFEVLGGEESQILDKTFNIGRYGTIKKQMSMEEYIKAYILPHTKTARFIGTTNDLKKEITTICVINGNGTNYTDIIIKRNDIDLFITGDIDYHLAMHIREHQLLALDIGHDFEQVVEKLYYNLFNKIILEENLSLEIYNNNQSFVQFTPWIPLYR